MTKTIKQFFSVLLSISMMASIIIVHVEASTIKPVQEISNSQISICSYGINGINQLMGKDRYQVQIEFENNTGYDLKLINFSFEGYDSKGGDLLSSQNNTNDLGQIISPGKTVKVNLLFPVSLTTLKIRVDKYELSDGTEHPIVEKKDYILNFAELSKEYGNQRNTSVHTLIGIPGDVVITGYSTFSIEGTPAIKVKFKNNTNETITNVQAKVMFGNSEKGLTYNAKLPIESSKEATHSGWGIANGVTSIEIGIISYTTASEKMYTIDTEKILWEQIDLDAALSWR